jgi:hypothetical protein
MSLVKTIVSSITYKSALNKILSTTTGLLVFVGVGSNADAATLNWKNLGWSETYLNNKYDSTDSGSIFTNVDGSGVDVRVEYSDNMWNGDPNLYKNHPLGSAYDDSLRFTNNTSGSADKTWVKLTFSEAVYIDEAWVGSLSTLANNRREWMNFSAYSDASLNSDKLVSASKYDTYANFFGNQTGTSTSGDYVQNADDPNLVGLDGDTGDKIYTTYGVGSQGNNTSNDKFGRVFFEYGDNAVKTLYIEHFVTQLDNSPKADDPLATGLTSVSIGNNIAFRRATKPPVPNPTQVPESSTILGLLVVGAVGSCSLFRNKALV